jgi:ABC-2 type transport system permease protein
MKFWSVVRKSFKEQIRQYWILFLTVSMAPFFVMVYYFINESTQPNYDILLLNQDKGVDTAAGRRQFGAELIQAVTAYQASLPELPLTLTPSEERTEALARLEHNEADALVILPSTFSEQYLDLVSGEGNAPLTIEFVGDLTDVKYLVSAVWAQEILNEIAHDVTGIPRPLNIVETGLGASGQIDEFDLYIPGILILSVVMLMFTATIAVVTEVENRTIIRLKLSRLSALEYLSGVSVVQVMIGVISVLLTLAVAILLGFDQARSLGVLITIAVLTSVSMIAFSLIVAALTNTVNEVLVVGNFPLFLFMFFTGAAFPIKSTPICTVAGYPLTIQGLMSPTHAISALNKAMILGLGWVDIMPEIAALCVVTAVYFAIGVWAFRRRHMKVE